MEFKQGEELDSSAILDAIYDTSDGAEQFVLFAGEVLNKIIAIKDTDCGLAYVVDPEKYFIVYVLGNIKSKKITILLDENAAISIAKQWAKDRTELKVCVDAYQRGLDSRYKHIKRVFDSFRK